FISPLAQEPEHCGILGHRNALLRDGLAHRKEEDHPILHETMVFEPRQQIFLPNRRINIPLTALRADGVKLRADNFSEFGKLIKAGAKAGVRRLDMRPPRGSASSNLVMISLQPL